MGFVQITTLVAGCAITTGYSKFRTPAWRPFRACIFVITGLSGIAPVVHGVYLYGTEEMNKSVGLWWVILQGVLYVSGAFFYAVGPCALSPKTIRLDHLNIVDIRHRHEYQSGLNQAFSTLLGRHIRYSTFVSCLRLPRI